MSVTESADILILECSASETVMNKYMFLLSHSVYSVLTVQTFKKLSLV